jgi:hypothetical protein
MISRERMHQVRCLLLKRGIRVLTENGGPRPRQSSLEQPGIANERLCADGTLGNA